MVNVVAVAAEAMELSGWLRRCGRVERLDWGVQFARAAEWNNARLYAVADGAGPAVAGAAARMALGNLFERGDGVSAVLSVGYCGALREGLELETVLTAVEVGDGENVWDAAPLRGVATGNVLSVDRFLGKRAEKYAWGKKGLAVVEMEAAGVARAAAEFGIPFRAAKVVTDLAGEEFGLDFNEHRDAAGRFNRGSIAMAGLRHPLRHGREIYRLATRGRRASETLGETLAKIRI